MMSKRKVLYICHNHPAVRPGGAEIYGLDLYEAMRASDEFEPVFLAKGGPPVSATRQPHEGTLLAAVNGDPNQYFFYTDKFDFDVFYGTVWDKDMYTQCFRDFLVAHRPDVVHFQHTLFLGYDILREIRNTLPEARVVYTLHEFMPICHRQGQMVRAGSEELCSASSPQRCHECFPEITPQAFFMRKRFIQSHLAEVDLFLAPSCFLLERYVAWGIPREKIRHEPNGRSVTACHPLAERDGPRTRLGFFGQFTPYKGVNVLLEAMRILGAHDGRGGSALLDRRGRTAEAPRETGAGPFPAAGDPRLWLYGANLELQPGAFQNEFRALLEDTRRNVTLIGRYSPGDLPRLMANIDWVVVPSVWWENAPLVIQEAFEHGRPVICSNVGGMAEHVTDGVNGLHFRVGDPRDLARVVRQAVSSPGLWERLRGGIPPVYRIENHVAALSAIYRALLEREPVAV